MGFKTAVQKIISAEGGYVNDPRDNGGETMCGISRKWYPKWDGWALVDQGLREGSEDLMLKVHEFYYTYYWLKLRLDRIDNEFIAEMLFNFAINMGKKTVIKKMQRVLHVKQDGLIGNQTLEALSRFDDEKFVYHFLLEIIEFYVQLGKDQPHYLLGWLNRAIHVYYAHQHSLY